MSVCKIVVGYSGEIISHSLQAPCSMWFTGFDEEESKDKTERKN